MKIRITKVGETLGVETTETNRGGVTSWTARTETELPWADIEVHLRLNVGDVVTISRASDGPRIVNGPGGWALTG